MTKFKTAIVQYDTKLPDWERFLEPGDSFPVCTLNSIGVGIMICYDREYPESARELMLGGAELILHPNCCGEMPPRLNELACRAMENMVYVAWRTLPVRAWAIPARMIQWYFLTARYTTILFSSAAISTRLYTMSISTSTSCAATDKPRISVSTADQTRTGGFAVWNRQYSAKTVLRGDQMRVFSLRA